MKKLAYILLSLPLLLLADELEFESKVCTFDCNHVMPSGDPYSDCGLNAFITADFLLWTARQDGLDYASTGGPGSGTRGKAEPSDFNFDPGFRVGLGKRFKHGDWDLHAEYTWFETTDHKRKVEAADLSVSTIRPLWYDGNASPELTPTSPILSFAQALWDLSLDEIDLCLGHRFFISRYLSLRPFIGLKGSWQSQKFDVRYRRDETINSIPLWKINLSQKFWGIGISSGLDTGWYFTRYWSLYGNFSLATLWSQFKVYRKDTQVNSAIEDSVGSVLLETENVFHDLKPVLQLSLGLQWNTSFRNDSYRFLVQAGWEEQVWWSQNQLYTTYEEAAHGDLILQGLTIKVRFDF